MKRNYILMLCEGALMVAAAELLGYLKLFQMPQGGSVSLMMLPITMYAYRWGLQRGLLAGFVLGVIDFMLNGGISIGWQSILGDYVIALTALGIGGVFHGKKWGFIPAVLLGCIGRLVVLYIVGAVIWGEYMPEEFLGMKMTNVWFYSLLYQIPIMLSVAACTVVGSALWAIPPVRKYIGAAQKG